jgi:hypothetical protein
MSDWTGDPYDYTGKEALRLERLHAQEIRRYKDPTGAPAVLRDDQIDPEGDEYFYDPKTGARLGRVEDFNG